MYLKEVKVHGFRAANEQPLACELPGRFAVLVGANSAGKSTVVDAIVLSHRDVFPFTPRPPASVLSTSVASRTIDVTYALEDLDTSPLGQLCGSTMRIPEWTTTLTSSMGRVSASQGDALGEGHLPLFYLSPTRNPGLDLAGREARLIVELLRAQAYRDRGDKSLKELRGLLGGLISSVTSKWPVTDAEARVASRLDELTVGVAGRIPFLGTTSIDDAFLARIFEFLLAMAGLPRSSANRLETEGLGYANLLQLAVILSAIPDLTKAEPAGESGIDGPTPSGPRESLSDDQAASAEDARSEDALRELMEEANERRELDDDTFFAGVFHAVVVLEEPEAHLHPQLQYGLVHYLKEVIALRPEVQVVMTTHSDEIVAACDPEDLVVLRRDSAGVSGARTIKSFNLSPTDLAKARRHLDVSRSAALFAQRSVLVEGVTDAIVLRAIARVWAGDDRIKRRFADALTVSIVGSRVGKWLPELLYRPGSEIVQKLAILRDTDGVPVPSWVTDYQSAGFRVFLSDPTLEPSITHGNQAIVRQILAAMKVTGIPSHDDQLQDWVADWFKKRGKSYKARFADDFAIRCERSPTSIALPAHLRELLDFVWNGFYEPSADHSPHAEVADDLDEDHDTPSEDEGQIDEPDQAQIDEEEHEPHEEEKDFDEEHYSPGEDEEEIDEEEYEADEEEADFGEGDYMPDEAEYLPDEDDQDVEDDF